MNSICLKVINNDKVHYVEAGLVRNDMKVLIRLYNEEHLPLTDVTVNVSDISKDELTKEVYLGMCKKYIIDDIGADCEIKVLTKQEQEELAKEVSISLRRKVVFVDGIELNFDITLKRCDADNPSWSDWEVCIKDLNGKVLDEQYGKTLLFKPDSYLYDRNTLATNVIDFLTYIGGYPNVKDIEIIDTSTKSQAKVNKRF